MKIKGVENWGEWYKCPDNEDLILNVPKNKKNKYKNKITIFDNIKFDSKMECDYYKYLLTIEDKCNIELQPKFNLQESFKYQGKTIRSIDYKADFQIGSNVYDVKGFTTKDFLIKAKLFKFKYPYLNLILVKYKNKQWIEY